MSKLTDLAERNRNAIKRMTQEEAARYLDCTVKTFRRIAKEMDLEFIRPRKVVERPVAITRKSHGARRYRSSLCDIDLGPDIDDEVRIWQKGPSTDRRCTYPGCDKKAKGWFRCEAHPFGPEDDTHSFCI